MYPLTGSVLHNSVVQPCDGRHALTVSHAKRNWGEFPLYISPWYAKKSKARFVGKPLAERHFPARLHEFLPFVVGTIERTTIPMNQTAFCAAENEEIVF
jgi:hypothetical protein